MRYERTERETEDTRRCQVRNQREIACQKMCREVRLLAALGFSLLFEKIQLFNRRNRFSDYTLADVQFGSGQRNVDSGMCLVLL